MKKFRYLSVFLYVVLVVVLFTSCADVTNIQSCAVNNTGGWYDFGFVLGSGILFGGGSSVSK